MTPPKPLPTDIAAGPLVKHIAEKDFQQQIVDLAHLMGWRVHHSRTAQNRQGQWVTPIQGDKGFPDLVLVRGRRCIFVEVKAENGKLTPAQKDWLFDLAHTGNEVWVWKPSLWPDIERALRRAS